MLRLRSLAIAALAALPLALPAAASADQAPGVYDVGIGTRSIAVNADGTFAGQKVYLGGFGIGGPSAVGPGLGDRYATGNLGVGPSVRAIVIGDGHGHDVAIADIEAQGYFAANRDAPLGIEDMRKAIAKAIPDLPADHVIVQSDHTHGGPDFMGVWGGTPLAYRQYAFDQTVAAIKDAYAQSKAPGHQGTLWYGTAPGRDLLNNQFDYDPANKVMDSDVRVLQARGADGTPFATLLNFSAHADVLGSSNRLATGDWPQTTNPMLEQRFGGEAMTMVGTLGRTQPNRPGCSMDQFRAEGDALCSLDSYSQEVVDRAADAVAGAQPLPGDALVAASSYLITDPASNPLLLGMLYGGATIGIPINRSMSPPFMTGNVIGTVTSTMRIGDVLLSAGPGEMYPQIPLKVRGVMEQLAAGVRGYMTAGLADDQLGYLIAPFPEAYPQPIKASMFDSSFANGDVLSECTGQPSPTCAGDPTPSPIDNDNYFFNVSHTMGERVTCSLLRGAGELFGFGTQARDAYDRCLAFGNDAAMPEGFDVTASDATSSVPSVPSSIPPQTSALGRTG